MFKQHTDPSVLVNEGAPTKKEIEDSIKSFDIEPNFTDITYEQWTLRLALYGKAYYHYKDTMSGTNKDCNMSFFMDKVGDEELARSLGMWTIEKTAPDMVIFWREFYGNRGKKEYEELAVKVDFRPEIKSMLKNY
jgi:hypothetical protein